MRKYIVFFASISKLTFPQTKSLLISANCALALLWIQVTFSTVLNLLFSARVQLSYYLTEGKSGGKYEFMPFFFFRE